MKQKKILALIQRRFTSELLFFKYIFHLQILFILLCISYSYTLNSPTVSLVVYNMISLAWLVTKDANRTYTQSTVYQTDAGMKRWFIFQTKYDCKIAFRMLYIHLYQPCHYFIFYFSFLQCNFIPSSKDGEHKIYISPILVQHTIESVSCIDAVVDTQCI